MAGKLKAIAIAKLKPGVYSDGGSLYLVVGDEARSFVLFDIPVLGNIIEAILHLNASLNAFAGGVRRYIQSCRF